MKPSDRLLSSPSRAHSAAHPHTPTNPSRRISQDGYVDDYEDVLSGTNSKKPETGFFGGHREPVKGRKWDHAREGDPVIMQSGVIPTSSPWRAYIKSSMYGPSSSEDGKIVDEDFLREQTPGYNKPWRGDIESNDDPEKVSSIIHSRKKRKSLMKRVQVRPQRIPGPVLVLADHFIAHSPHASTCAPYIPGHCSYNIDHCPRLINLCPPSFKRVRLCSEPIYHYGYSCGCSCCTIYSLHHLG